MPVYHFTIHAYRSWRPDHPRGYTRKGIGYLPPDPEAADVYGNAAQQDPVSFDDALQRELLVVTHAICGEEGWRLEGMGFDPTHMHALVSWRTFVRWEEVDRRLKNLLSLRLSRARGITGKRWFARRQGAPRQVRHESHLHYLLTRYLPDHPGIFWKRGMPLPDQW